jgi:hypothetical protein
MPVKQVMNRLLTNQTSLRLLRGLHDAYAWSWSAFSNRFPLGTNVYDRDWDLLILLDCCRVDALRAVADEYDFVRETSSLTSVGSTSREWIAKTFTPAYRDEIARTAYVTSNVYPRTVLEWERYEFPHREGSGDYRRAHMRGVGFDVVDPADFLHLDQVWKTVPDEYKRHGKTLPAYLTDRAIEADRDHDPDRLIVHYMYPHGPYIAGSVEEDREMYDYEENPMTAVRSEAVERETVWEAYLDELRFVLDDVERLLNSVDAETAVISADHGEAFGEWGLYAHLLGSPSPHVKRVPWVETTASNTGAYEIRTDRAETDEDDSTGDVADRLEALGYR